MENEFYYLNEIPMSIFVIDKDYNFVFWNKYLEQHSGIKAEEAVGQNIYKKFPNLDSRIIKMRIKGVLGGGPPATFSSLLNKHFIPITLPNGTLAFQDCVIKSLHSSGKGKGHAIGALQDVTEIHNRNEQIKEIQKKLIAQIKKSNDQLIEFSSLVSHDLKSPLRAIQAYMDFLKEDYDENPKTDIPDWITKVDHNIDEMNNLMDSLLYYSKIGNSDESYKSFDVTEMVNGLITTVTPLLKKQNCIAKVADSFPPIIGDEVRIKEVFRNLIDNALKYNDKDEKILEIGHKEKGGLPYYFVRDNGMGIKKEHQEAVFKMFRRLHKKDDFGGGVGAGLGFVKKIIDLHNGEIWIESKESEGTSFCFNIGHIGQPDSEVASEV